MQQIGNRLYSLVLLELYVYRTYYCTLRCLYPTKNCIRYHLLLSQM
nr:MAG TPA: hypothetical protein [Caudoviricetes sp.]